MAGTVVAVFNDRVAAHKAAHNLIDNGVSINDISVVVKEYHDEPEAMHDSEHPVLESSVREVDQHDVEQPNSGASGAAGRAAAGVTVGVSLGALVGSMLILVPGVGPLVAAGPLAALLGTSIAGGVLGGVAAALAKDGIPEKAAISYHDEVAKGSALVTVLSSADRAEKDEAVLENSGGRQIGFYPSILDSVQSVES